MHGPIIIIETIKINNRSHYRLIIAIIAAIRLESGRDG